MLLNSVGRVQQSPWLAQFLFWLFTFQQTVGSGFPEPNLYCVAPWSIDYRHFAIKIETPRAKGVSTTTERSPIQIVYWQIYFPVVFLMLEYLRSFH